jgi:putative membrane protein insertion efficiency factor
MQQTLRNRLQHFIAESARHIGNAPRALIIGVITAYQHTLSPDHGPLKYLNPHGYCRHSPTCSQYAKEQIGNRGLMIGGLLSMKRLLSCHPFAKISDEKWAEMAKRQWASIEHGA